MKKKIVERLNSIFLSSFIALNSQSVLASEINVQKNLLTEEEKTVMKYTQNLRDEELPNDFIVDPRVIGPGGVVFFLDDTGGVA